jgi:hypothetical protein
MDIKNLAAWAVQSSQETARIVDQLADEVNGVCPTRQTPEAGELQYISVDVTRGFEGPVARRVLCRARVQAVRIALVPNTGFPVCTHVVHVARIMGNLHPVTKNHGMHKWKARVADEPAIRTGELAIEGGGDAVLTSIEQLLQYGEEV